MWSVKWLVLWSLWAVRLMLQPTPEVRVRGGWLRGSVAPSGTHTRYLGIPYATVEQRFQAPGPEPTWEGVFEAVNENVRCVQELLVYSNVTMGQEQCLSLNVYTPLNTLPDDQLPVMVFFHGGGYFEGSSSPFLLGPEYLISKGIILVTVNYRVNIQGFLCLGIKEAPGNAGLKDQVAALRWVRSNIGAFGGDEENVTIFGESAGAASVSYHLISPMSKGLFHKAITQSGSSLAAWALQYDPVYRASQKAKVLGFQSDSQDPKELYNFLSKYTDVALVSHIVPKSEGGLLMTQLIFLPCVEAEIEGVEPFLTKTPYEYFSTGNFAKVPMIMGATAEEGLFFVGMEKDTDIPLLKVEANVPRNLAFPSNADREDVAKKMKRVFFGDDENISLQNIYNLSTFIGETFLNFPVLDEIDVILRHSDKSVYSYVFGYDGRRNIARWVHRRKQLQHVGGATHADDLFYLFSQPLLPSLFENKIIDQWTTMWTNFAKYGDPTPSLSELLPVRWPALTKELASRRSLLIDEPFDLIPQQCKSYALWKDALSKYRRKHTWASN